MEKRLKPPAAPALPALEPGERINYVAFFLTLACNLRCPWCINMEGGLSRAAAARRPLLSADDWIRAADRLRLRPDLPLTLQGGEPTLHPGFFRLAAEARPDLKMDLLTNLSFDIDRFIREVPVARFTREAPYAAIRASWHPGQNDLADLKRRAARLMEAGFRVGLYALDPPDPESARVVRSARDAALAEGFDFRLKEYLGTFGGRIVGTFKYEGAVGGARGDRRCRTSELIVAPDGAVHRCHADLYNDRPGIASILDPAFSVAELDRFRPCDTYGACNPCDVKVKTNRFQIFGHTSVEILPADAGETGAAR